MSSRDEDHGRKASDAESNSVSGIADEVARTRDEFAATVGAIEDRLSPRANIERVKSRVAADPKVLAAAAGAAAGVAAAVTGVARLVARSRR